MKYYVVTDVHGFYTELKTALEAQGFFADTQPHKLIICGDLFDRGSEALKMQKFILDLMEREEVILIRGNHEDLILDLLEDMGKKSYVEPHHAHNGTLDTVCQLTGISGRLLPFGRLSAGRKLLKGPLVQKIIPAMVDYYETAHYIFVHGWIPCQRQTIGFGETAYEPLPDWREADEAGWMRARWINGMEAAHEGILEAGKTIVCGHWHTSFGHAVYEGKGSEFGQDVDLSPYYSDGIIALDGCTAYSGKVNCIVLEDE